MDELMYRTYHTILPSHKNFSHSHSLTIHTTKLFVFATRSSLLTMSGTLTPGAKAAGT